MHLDRITHLSFFTPNFEKDQLMLSYLLDLVVLICVFFMPFIQFPESIAFTFLLIITPLLVLCPIHPPAICLSYLSKATFCDLTS